MTDEDIFKAVSEYHKKLIANKKGYKVGNIGPENSEIVNKCLDYWSSLKKQQEEENQPKQLELFN